MREDDLVESSAENGKQVIGSYSGAKLDLRSIAQLQLDGKVHCNRCGRRKVHQSVRTGSRKFIWRRSDQNEEDSKSCENSDHCDPGFRDPIHGTPWNSGQVEEYQMGCCIPTGTPSF